MTIPASATRPDWNASLNSLAAINQIARNVISSSSNRDAGKTPEVPRGPSRFQGPTPSLPATLVCNSRARVGQTVVAIGGTPFECGGESRKGGIWPVNRGYEPRPAGRCWKRCRSETWAGPRRLVVGPHDREVTYPMSSPNREATVTLDLRGHMGLISRIESSPADPSRSTRR